jgi:poly-gamma-glutamate synthesis protein (capsule biosynthesis protein)
MKHLIAPSLFLISSVALGANPLVFKDACTPGESLTIAAMGDVLLHQPLQVQGFTEKDGHVSLWRNVLPYIEGADVAYANMEGPVAGPVNIHNKLDKDPGKRFDGNVYTGYPRFNYNPLILQDLRDSGFDVMSTANNHAMDRGPLGADRTIDNFLKIGLQFTGTRKSDDKTSPWQTITQIKGMRLAWIACTFDTNGISDPNHQVLLCYKDSDRILKLVSELSKSPDIDGVIVTPHWGEEYEQSPGSDQKKLAHQLLEAGATAVIGSHPHVLQPWEKYVTADGREGFVVYSLGNFVSNQRELPRRSSIMVMLGLTLSPTTGKAVINGVRYFPVTMDFGGRPFRLHVSSPTEYTDSWKHVTGMFGMANVADAKRPFVTHAPCTQ